MNINKILFTGINYSLNELKGRLFFLLFSIFIFRFGIFIPIPGINLYLLSDMLNKNHGTFWDMFNLFSGGSLFHASVFTLGIMPYISSSIIIQLLTSIHPSFVELRKDGSNGRYKINKYTRYLTLFLSIFQSVFASFVFINLNNLHNIYFNKNFVFYFVTLTSLVSGTMFLMWLGEQITEKGLGNGVSMIIFIGIISNLPNSLYFLSKNIILDLSLFFRLFFVLAIIFLITLFVVFVERAQRKILVQYASRRKRSSVYFFLHLSQDTFLPLKINIAGVIPAIFSSSVMIFSSSFLVWLMNFTKIKIIRIFIGFFFYKQFLYLAIYLFFIMFFCFFYTMLIFNVKDTADNLHKSGAYIPGVRPGDNTSKYISKIISRLILFGSFYVCIVCLVPEFVNEVVGVSVYFSGTSLLIVVVVIVDIISQVQTLIMSNKYLSFLKK